MTCMFPSVALARLLGQHRSTQRKVPRGREDEERLTADMIALARQYGRYGYRKIAEFRRRAGWQVNDKPVERLWRRERLKVPAKQPKRPSLKTYRRPPCLAQSLRTSSGGWRGTSNP